MSKKKKADLILIVCLLLISGILFVVRSVTRSDGAVAVVYVDGTRKAEYSLDEDRIVRFKFDDGGSLAVESEFGMMDSLAGESEQGEEQFSGYNVLEIKDGYASVIEADCPDKICVETHKIKYNGESITCLPHKLQVVIEGGEGGVDL